MTAPTTFPARLRAFATRHRLSTAELAALLGVPLTTANKWLAGTRNPSAAAARLLDVLERLDNAAPLEARALLRGATLFDG